MDKEKVIKTLEERISTCSMIGDGFDVTINWRLADDILALLKEQEAVEPSTDEYGNKRCGNCGYKLQSIADPDLFCCKCGKAVLNM